jgi:hypothetical protein
MRGSFVWYERRLIMPAGTTLSQVLGALVNEIEISILFPVLGKNGLVSLKGVITDVGDDHVKWQSTPKATTFISSRYLR